MKIAVVGSRGIIVNNLGEYLPEECEEIVSGNAKVVDSCAADYAKEKGLKLKLFLPEYEKYGKAAPIVRNKQIVDYADEIIAFWDGTSKGTLSVINYAKKRKKTCKTIILK